MKSLRHLLSLLAVALCAGGAESGDYWTYFGTYTGPKSKGIYAARFDTRTGKFGGPQVAGEMTNPTFLAVHPNKRFLYAVGEVGNFGGRKSGSVAAFSIDAASGKLTMLNQQPSGGDGPCHVFVDPTGKCVLAANYGGGSVTAMLVKDDGSLSEPTAFIQHAPAATEPKSKQKPHGHCMITDPSNKYALACDLGLDQVLIYNFDAERGTLKPHDPAFGASPAGAGPRHITLHPNGKFAYVINELGCTMTTFAWDGTRGTLDALQTISTLPVPKEKGFSTAEVQVHPSGRFVYGSNRGHDSISVFTVDSTTGTLTRTQTESTQGKMPRHFTLDPTAKFLVAENQGSDNAIVFSVDEQTGRIQPTGTRIEVPAPVCAVFVQAK